MNEEITPIISELKHIHQNIIRIIEDLYNSLADYLDPAKYQKKKKQFGFLTELSQILGEIKPLSWKTLKKD